MRTASLSPLPSDSRKLMPAPATASPTNVTTVAIVEAARPPPPPGAKPGVLGVLPAKLAAAGDSVPVAAAMPRARRQAAQRRLDDPGRRLRTRSEAKQRLSAAQSKAKDLLGQADPFTERMVKGDKTLYRARFAGLDNDQAEAACKHLKRNEIACMVLKN